MSKNVKISLEGIAGQIDKATRELTKVKPKARTVQEKKRLAVKIRKLKAIKNILPCRGLNIVVPVK